MKKKAKYVSPELETYKMNMRQSLLADSDNAEFNDGEGGMGGQEGEDI